MTTEQPVDDASGAPDAEDLRALATSFPLLVVERWREKVEAEGYSLSHVDAKDAIDAAEAVRAAWNATVPESDLTPQEADYLRQAARAKVRGACFRKKADRFVEDAARASAFGLALLELSLELGGAALKAFTGGLDLFDE